MDDITTTPANNRDTSWADATPKLGFGLMRLPRKGIGIDIAQTSDMVDAFLDAGFTYFDTAHVYPGSEVATRKALVERHPRDTYTIATKLNAFLFVRNEAGARKQFDTSLSRMGLDYIDFYLLHSLMDNNVSTYDRYRLWDYPRELKAAGKIHRYGFSFHAGPTLLDRLLSEHPDVDFVQLQLNYADWENKNVTSRANYEVARAHGVPIVVMEPVKGGSLANPPKKVRSIFDKTRPGVSYASWAIRFAASLDGVATVLSGMSNISQMRDNLATMRNFKPLDAQELAAIREAQKLMGSSAAIPCTTCHYCTGTCPRGVAIPEIFEAMNIRLVSGQMDQAARAYKKALEHGSAASACIACGHCERACPQHIAIIDNLKRCAEVFDAS